MHASDTKNLNFRFDNTKSQIIKTAKGIAATDNIPKKETGIRELSQPKTRIKNSLTGVSNLAAEEFASITNAAVKINIAKKTILFLLNIFPKNFRIY